MQNIKEINDRDLLGMFSYYEKMRHYDPVDAMQEYISQQDWPNSDEVQEELYRRFELAWKYEDLCQ